MLYNLISNEMKEAMKNHDKETLSTLRMLKSSIDLDRINSKLEEITDDLVIKTVSKQIKTLEASIVEFEKGSRDDLVSNANREIKLLKKYLPEQLSDEEVSILVDSTINELGACDIKDMGRVIKELSAKLKGRADMGKVSSLVKEKLN